MGLFDLVFRTCSLDFRFSWESWLVKRHGHENERPARFYNSGTGLRAWAPDTLNPNAGPWLVEVGFRV